MWAWFPPWAPWPSVPRRRQRSVPHRLPRATCPAWAGPGVEAALQCPRGHPTPDSEAGSPDRTRQHWRRSVQGTQCSPPEGQQRHLPGAAGPVPNEGSQAFLKAPPEPGDRQPMPRFLTQKPRREDSVENDASDGKVVGRSLLGCSSRTEPQRSEGKATSGAWSWRPGVSGRRQRGVVMEPGQRAGER